MSVPKPNYPPKLTKMEARLIIEMINKGDMKGQRRYRAACLLASRAWDVLMADEKKRAR